MMKEMDERIPPEWYRKQIAVEGYDEQNCKNEIIGNREYIQVLEDRTNRYEQEIESLREQLENMMVVVASVEKQRNAIALALETENQVATRYAQQMAYWIEKCDVVRKERDAALKTDQELVAWYDPDAGLPFGWSENPPTPNAVFLYLHPAPVISSEPVAWMNPDEDDSGDAFQWGCEWKDEGFTVPLYTHPARTLSDEQISQMFCAYFGVTAGTITDHWLGFIRSVLEEAK